MQNEMSSHGFTFFMILLDVSAKNESDIERVGECINRHFKFITHMLTRSDAHYSHRAIDVKKKSPSPSYDIHSKVYNRHYY